MRASSSPRCGGATVRPIDLPPAGLDTVRRILRDHAPGLEARAFGSRVSWTARETSDLDLVLMTESPLDAGRMAALRAAFSGSDLPFRVDVADWAAVSEDFRAIIEREYVVLTDEKSNAPRPWAKATLGDVADLRISGVDKKIDPSEIPVRLCNYTDVYYNNFVHAGLKFMPGSATKKEIDKCALYPGDVVITKDSEKHDDIGVPALVRDSISDLICGYHLAILRPDSSVIDGSYLFYALNSYRVQKQFHAYANGITRFGLRKTDIHRVEIPLPSLPEQRAIADVLGALDDKIELNRRMNETLEAMARAIFDDWFVNFGPVRAKMERRKPYLAPEIWRLFPDRIDADTGAPEGWRPGVLADIAVSENRAVAPAEVAADTPYIGLEHMPRRSIALSRWGRADQVKTPKLRFEAGEFLFGRLRPYFHKAGVAPFDGICSTTIAVVRPVSQEWSAPVLACISSASFVDFADRSSTGTTMPQTSWEALSRYELAIPPPALAAAYGDAVAPMLDRIVANVRESHALADARDALLPRLMSGRLRVGDAEKAAA